MQNVLFRYDVILRIMCKVPFRYVMLLIEHKIVCYVNEQKMARGADTHVVVCQIEIR